MTFQEHNFESAIIELFARELGYEFVHGPEVERDYRQVVREEELMGALRRVNKDLPDEALAAARNKILNLSGEDLLERNITFHDYLQNGVAVNFWLNEQEQSALVRVVDFELMENNSFVIANQWTVVENSQKRPDLVVFVNGLPLVVMEVKSPVREEAEIEDAYRQLKNYQREIPSLFYYNAFLVISDLMTTRAGTITSGLDRFMEWKSVDGTKEEARAIDYVTLFKGMFEKGRLLDIIKHYLCFSVETEKTRKILAAYHQFFAVNKAIVTTRKATETDGRGGVFWHTQGSGKSFSMVFYAQKIQHELENPTLLVLTDRNDLDDQLYSQFVKCQDFLRQTPVQAESREHLKDLLRDREASGIIFTTMQKFSESEEPLSERRNIIVIADEAHRSQYGLRESIDQETGRVKTGVARVIRNSLPGATYIGFTGTPIAQKDRNTREVFGEYIDVYDMTQAVEDGATRPVYYESRVIKLHLDPTVLQLIDAEYDILSEQAEEVAIERSKRDLGKLETILAGEQTVDSLVRDIIGHYENNRASVQVGKAMVVAYSRTIAMRIYKKILELRPEWGEKVALVMTSANTDEENWLKVIGNKSYKEELAVKFKDDQSELKIAIVVDMWLTGFDVPSLSTMYVYKPMMGHNLMQAIARVNRVFGDKEGGLIVDYVGIARALRQAMRDYTVRDRNNFGDPNVAETAYPQFQQNLEICRDFFFGFSYEQFFGNNNSERAGAISEGVEFILDKNHQDEAVRKEDKTGELFLKHCKVMTQALSLCSSLASKEERLEAAYFEAVRAVLAKFWASDKQKISLAQINERINELLQESIKSEGVINLFSQVEQEFSIFDPKFLQEIAGMTTKNISIELLKKLIAEQVRIYQRINVVKSEKFSKILQEKMNQYLNGMLSNEEVIAELLALAKEIVRAKEEGDELGLSATEQAFYDALTLPRAVEDFYTHDQLVKLTRDLYNKLQTNKTIDWQNKHSARAKMRMMIKTLLKEYNYPPEGLESSVATVMRQCEAWVDNEMEV